MGEKYQRHGKGKQSLEPKEEGVGVTITFIPKNKKEKENIKATAVKSKR